MSTELNTAARSDQGPYGRLACAYAVAGVPTFPVCPLTKKPLVRQYAARRAPSLRTVELWARRYPHANLGFATRRAKVVVLDADDEAALAFLKTHSIEPVLRSLTPKGEHWWFADPTSQRRGGNRPTDRAYDIKAAQDCHLVILPASVSPNGDYRLADGDLSDTPGLVAERLRRLTPLADETYASLMGTGQAVEQPREPYQTSGASNRIALLALDRVPKGQRNRAVFAFARRECRQIRRDTSDAAGQDLLLDRVARYNQVVCDPPLETPEVEKTGLSAWRWELANMQRLPANRRRDVREALIQHCGEPRAVALLLVLSQTTQPGEDLVLAPARLVGHTAIPGWSQTDYRAAISALIASGRLRITERPRRGRGNVGAYRLAAPLETALDATVLLSRLSGDADAAVLYAVIAEQWGAPATAELSVRGMCAQHGGPFGTWDERRLRRARGRLETVGLLQRHDQARLGPRTPRAMFFVRSTDVPAVLKITGIAPEDSHRPQGTGEERGHSSKSYPNLIRSPPIRPAPARVGPS